MMLSSGTHDLKGPDMKINTLSVLGLMAAMLSGLVVNADVNA